MHAYQAKCWKEQLFTIIKQISCQRKKGLCSWGNKPNKSIRYPQFRILDDLDKRKKCQEIDAAGAMHRFGGMGVWSVFCKNRMIAHYGGERNLRRFSNQNKRSISVMLRYA
jgi:hypothetical protein